MPVFDQWKNNWPNPIIKRDLQGDVPERYLGVANAMMFNLKSIMELGQLDQFQMTKTLGDGSVVTVRSIFGQDFINITTPIAEVVPEVQFSEGYQIRIIRDYDHKIMTDSLEDNTGMSLFYLIHNPPYADVHQAWPIVAKYNPGTQYWSIQFTFPKETQFTQSKFNEVIQSGGFWITAGGAKALTVQLAKNNINDPYMVIYRDEQWQTIDKVKPGSYTILLPYRAITHTYYPGMAFATIDISPWITQKETQAWNGRSVWPIWWKAFDVVWGKNDADWFVESPWPAPKPIYQFTPYTMFSVSQLSFIYNAICTAPHRIQESYHGPAVVNGVNEGGYNNYKQAAWGQPPTVCRDAGGGDSMPQTCWTFNWFADPGENDPRIAGTVVSTGGMNLSWDGGASLPPIGTQYQWSGSDNGSIILNIVPTLEGWIVIQGYTSFNATIEPPAGKQWL